MLLTTKNFTGSIDGKEIHLYQLSNKNGISTTITNYGGKIISLFLPDKNGHADDIVAGYNSISEYVSGNKYFGAIVGRFANRILNGSFRIGDKSYSLTLNNKPNHIHGGYKSFSDVVWDAKGENQRLILSYFSKDGEEGYPGNLSVQCTFELNDANELHILFEAETDVPTIINLTHHSFFNLKGHDATSIADHELKLNADYYLPLTDDFVPTGILESVENTSFDFKNFHTIGERINEDTEQLKIGKGYDHCFALNGYNGKINLAATLREPVSGRVMEVYTTAPGIQLYTGNWLDGSDKGKGGKQYHQRSMICLEPQHFPDAPNHPNFPNVILNPGEKYQHHIIYKFYIQ